MADPHCVAMLIDSTAFKIQQLQHAFTELESRSAISLNVKWKELEAHFHGLEISLKTKFEELKNQEKEYVAKVSETQDILEKREAVVVSKELASLDRLQEKRDAALSAIFDNHRISPLKPSIDGANTDVSNFVSKTNTSCEDKSGFEDVRPVPNGNAEGNCPELMKLCEDMDAEGLHKFISDNRKNLSFIREEIPVALRSASNPFVLVLKSLKNFYTGDILGSDGKKDGTLLGLRRTCLMLMESLEQLMSDGSLASLSAEQMLTSDIKEKAKAIARMWKPKIDELHVDASSGNSLEAHAFLQLLATFDMVSEFNQEDICKLMPAVTRRRQAVDLCRSLGLSEKMPGLIEILLSCGRQIEAVNLAIAFELTEQFAPVPLLKAYLKEVRKSSQVKAGSMSPGAQNEADERELAALKVVIKCVEDHKLEEQYPVDPLQERITELEKAKADKRRSVETAKPQCKRPRANGTIYAPRITSMPDKNFHRAPLELASTPEKSFYRAPLELTSMPEKSFYRAPPELTSMPEKNFYRAPLEHTNIAEKSFYRAASELTSMQEKSFYRAPSELTSMPEKSFYRAPAERYAYPYDRQYAYPTETHHPTLMISAPYTISPTHTTYYGTNYHVQYQTAYLH